ncbi:Crp/Fnr family transcriptional regulator [Curvibacter sp. RS43]|uniref:Crp/Fnr family transcriptional regulator n=1 Tax=Curvibacter microcysteis TaxID=3026419 RepID=UPI00235DE30D|nr:Crp/Fnr family transcriptional regulator [Curvibacter sp. RS43]MDD0812911.1 Crp/Fnr family transcriptional regulator [Curvibacter sp. RS43]
MTTILSNLDLLKRVPLFSPLTAEQADAIADVVNKRHFKRGEILVKQHHRSDELFILLAGRVRLVSSHKSGRQMVLNKLRSGEILDEISLIDDLPHSATALAEIPTDVLTLSRSDFMRCMQDNSHIAHAVMSRLVQRLRQADRKIESLALMDVHGRVGRALVEHAAPSDGGAMVIHEKISRQDIAKMVGASREMVSRVMKDLEARGFIQTNSPSRMTLRESLVRSLA